MRAPAFFAKIGLLRRRPGGGKADGVGRRMTRSGAGIAAAALGAAVLLLVIDRQEDATLRNDLAASTQRMLARAEAPVAAATEQLAALAAVGRAGCGIDALAAFRAAIGGPIRNLGVVDPEGRLICAGGPAPTPPERILPRITPRMPKVTIEIDARLDRRRTFIAWTMEGGMRLVAETEPTEPELVAGPPYADGRLAAAVMLSDGRVWRETSPAPADLGDDALRRSAASLVFPIRAETALPAGIHLPGFAAIRRAVVLLALVTAVALAVLGWRGRGRAARAASPAASPVRPFYWPVYQIDTRRLIGLDLMLAAAGGDELPPSEAAAAVDARLLDRVLTEVSPILRRAPDLRVSFPLDVTGDGADRLIAHLPGALSRLAIDPAALVVRVASEATAGAVAIERIADLRKQGFAIASDGAGRGRYLVLSDPLPDFLFIDGRLAADLATSEEAVLIMEAAVGLARRLDLGVIARGIAGDDGLTVLRSVGVTSGAGPVFGRPLSARAALEAAPVATAERQAA